ncbi:choline sulfate utilization transcriptional regulator [Paraburkholderia sacchari]|uniref:LysR family transcriptional regulator n=1 Tax=Paraburkholderia sacchari TaxID=159450 RepID=A0A8T6ZEL2_9BURK|nr:LysR family transcriptional regulator [Paraburkholderia sacchari]NLP62710.1 LysR family transcriptional regulator [Paraburkholderia sacchari]
MSGPDRLPPMQTLSAFESAARLASFTAAARELGSTQPAVSQRIVQLEEDLGAPLFERGHRGVTLTAEGALLYEAVRSGLDTIREATTCIRARRATGALTILTDAGFATYWLMPRLARLKASMPGVNVKIVTSQLGYDPHRDHADIAIAFGDGHWPPCTSTRLFAEAVTPVCSPAFRDAHRAVSHAADLAALPLLHVQPTQPERWLAWDTWFAAHGLAAPEESQGLMFNSYSLVVQAALMGQGVALGWTPLTDELIASGLLVRLLDTPVTSERGYYLVCPPARPAPAAVPLFRRWLFNELSDVGTREHT